MITPEQAHHGINLGFHILILFTFLTIFFFTFIAQKERDAVTKELNNVINKNVPAVMDNIDKMNKRLGNKLDWGQVNDMANKIEEKYGNKPDPSIDAHNKRLIKIAVIICGCLLLILIGAIVYFTVYKKMDIGLGTILLENFVIAVLIGIIEAVFFLNVALKYSPVTTSDMMNQLIDRAEYHINEQLEQ